MAAADGIVRAEAERVGGRCQVELDAGDGVPGLVPAFARMADIHPRPRMFRRAVGGAALAIAETELDSDRFLLFFLAWVRGKPLDAILETLGRRNRREGRSTLQRRLRRISDTIRDALVDAIVPALPYLERTWLRASIAEPRGSRARPLPPPAVGSWALLARAMDAVIREEPLGDAVTDPDSDASVTARM
ncbi:MAG: hypothetical protein L6Q95_06955 [Planctomycetes bacterium]|nr:hypothetical protein [Planctomycetota bacterium]